MIWAIRPSSKRMGFMKTSYLATAAMALASVFVPAARAEAVTFTSCSKDGKTVTMTADVEGGLKDGDLRSLIQQSLDQTAHAMDSGAPTGIKGFYAVADNINAALKDKDVTDPTRIVLMPLTAGAPGCTVN